MEKREQDLINRLNAFEYDPDKNGLEVYEGELDTAVEISISLLSEFIDQELDKARREYFSMGMEYFSLIDDSNIYQKKGWKLSEEKAERLQILDKMFNLLKDNK